MKSLGQVVTIKAHSSSKEANQSIPRKTTTLLHKGTSANGVHTYAEEDRVKGPTD
jgi:hypothetical protein